MIEDIEQVKDVNVRNALLTIAKEIEAIKKIPPVGNNLQEVAFAVNKITGNL